MKFTLSSKLASYGLAAILLSETVAVGEEVASMQPGASTTVFITDRDDSPAPVPPVQATSRSAHGSLAIVQPPTSLPGGLESKLDAANKSSPPKPRRGRGDLVFVPARPVASKELGRAPRPPSARGLVSRRKEQIELTSHEPPLVEPKPPVATPKQVVEKPQPKPLDRVDELLLAANEASQQASSEADYTAVLDPCVEAIRLRATAERKMFARQLASWALNRRGELRMDAGREDQANADFQSALDYNANNWRALHNRGVSLAQAGNLAAAFDDFNRAVEMNPDYAKAYANRATLYVQANDLNAALADYEKAIEVDGQLANAHVGLARVFHMLGRLEEAVARFGAAVQVAPANSEILCSRADLLADLGRYRAALGDYARTIELDPEFGHAYRNGAWLLATCPEAEFRDAENAVIGARRALELGYGERHVALDTLAAAQANAGDFQQAAATEEEAVDLARDEIKFAYLARMQLYREGQPFRTQPVGSSVSQAVYEATDQ